MGKAGLSKSAKSAAALTPRWLKPTHRVFLAVFLNYAVFASFVSAAGLGSEASGFMSKEDGLLWAILFAFFAFPAAIVWVFSETRVWRIWLTAGISIGTSLVAIAMLGGDISFGIA